jgi:hypothetical protein
MFLKNIILSLLFFTSFICGQNTVKNNSPSLPKGFIKEIIFLGPSKSELDSTMNDEDAEVYSDYYYYITKAAPKLKILGIKTKDTTSRIIKINYDNNKMQIFERGQNSIGYIFNDGEQNPILIKYVMTDIDIISKAEDFFHIK